MTDDVEWGYDIALDFHHKTNGAKKQRIFCVPKSKAALTSAQDSHLDVAALKGLWKGGNQDVHPFLLFQSPNRIMSLPLVVATAPLAYNIADDSRVTDVNMTISLTQERSKGPKGSAWGKYSMQAHLMTPSSSTP
ncbi:MAG: hypothetical protein FRX49_13260 [Trebouxia sp. A1-2]|nr:MAG: hypothetical protein FRX49_13260 [Trebouxia sp. A1-2]